MSIKSTISSLVKRILFKTYIYDTSWLDAKIKLQNSENYDTKGRQIMTDIDNVFLTPAEITQRKSKLIEDILNKKIYSFKKSLVIINPYGIAPLSAIVIFNTDVNCTVKYTILGQRGSEDYVNYDNNYTTKHQTAILGLYSNAFNIVKLELLDKDGNCIDSKKILINSHKNSNFNFKVNIKKTSDNIDKFCLVTGGYSEVTYAFDKNGNIRYLQSRQSYSYGIHLLDDTNYLFVEKRMRCPNYGNAHSVIMHEMDFLGRAYKTIKNEKGVHHFAKNEDGNNKFIISSSSIDDGFEENVAAEIDLLDGMVKRSINVKDIFDDTYKTRHDWAHINAIDYIKDEDAVLLCMRNIHSIAKVNMKTGVMEWLFANPDFYKKTKQIDKVLQPVGDIEWFFQQHAVKIIERKQERGHNILKIMLFDNHTANRRPVSYFDDVKKSYICIYTIDETDKTVKMNNRFETQLSVTRSNAVLDTEKNLIYAMCGNIKPVEDNIHAKVLGYDLNTKELKEEIECEADFFCGQFIDFDITKMSASVPEKTKNVIGMLKCPYKASETEFKSFSKKDYDLFVAFDLNSQKIKLRILGDILQIYNRDHTVEKIFLKSEKNLYIQDFTDTVQENEIFMKQCYHVSMPLDNLPAEKYEIFFQYLGKIYKTEKFIKIIEK